MANAESQTDVLVIGAGLCGLTAAYELEKNNIHVTVVEKNSTTGGVIQSEEKEGYLLEKGPHTFQNTGADIMALCDELGLKPSASSPIAKNRFIFSQGKLNPVPMSPLGFLASDLLTFNAKMHVLSEPFIKPSSKNDEDISVADFTRNRLGNEVLSQMVTPFLSGVYAGDPEQLSALSVFPKLVKWERDDGSIVKGAVKSKLKGGKKNKTKQPYALMNFDNGMTELPQALTKQLTSSVLYNTTVTDIEETPEGYRCTLVSNSQIKTIHSRHILFATPAYVTSDFIKPFNADLSALLESIDYAPIATCQLGIELASIKNYQSGFGFLIPRTTSYDLLGCIFTSQLFPKRAPDGHELWSCFTGGALNREIVNWSDEAIIEEVLKELKVVLKEDGLKANFQQVDRWEKAIPQYTMGHTKTVTAIYDTLRDNPRITLTGNYMDGVSLNDCVKHAKSAAAVIQSKLGKIPAKL